MATTNSKKTARERIEVYEKLKPLLKPVDHGMWEYVSGIRNDVQAAKRLGITQQLVTGVRSTFFGKLKPLPGAAPFVHLPDLIKRVMALEAANKELSDTVFHYTKLIDGFLLDRNPERPADQDQRH